MISIPAVYQGLEPEAVWQHFAALNSIPRPSGQEEAVRQYVRETAEEHGAMWKTDTRGNICVRVRPRGPQHDEGLPIVVLQSHLDMVCQKRPGVNHDFVKDAIIPRRDRDFIYASGTTLGADNGIGCAMMLAVLTSPELIHGPLELLFTVEEETGLYGAALLDPEIVFGRMLINLDSEDPDEITIGCAGGAGTTLHIPVERENTSGLLFQRITVSGLKGGHSGIEINQPLGNAIKLVNEILVKLLSIGIRLVGIEGGTAHNAIPRDASAIVAFDPQSIGLVDEIWKEATQTIEKYWRADEPGLFFQRENVSAAQLPLSLESSAAVVKCLADLPHGVQKMSERFAGKVQTSSNLAEVKTTTHSVETHVSNRSFLASDMDLMQDKCAEVGKQANARIEVRDGYPGWEPRGESPLLEKTVAAFAANGLSPKVEVVHAGLECGLLLEKIPTLDAVSFGPLIRGAHTPEEYVSISSTAQIWRVLTTLLQNLSK
jgi:dipeptidase D